MDSVDAAFGLMSLLSVVFALAVYIWLALALGAVFRKVGEGSWKGWVPVYNVATLLRSGGLSPWWALLMVVPVAATAVFAVAAHRVGRGFGYGAAMTVVAVFVPPVWASVVGFGPARWLGAHRWRVDAVATPPQAPAPVFTPPAAFAPSSAPVVPRADEVPTAFPPPPASAFPSSPAHASQVWAPPGSPRNVASAEDTVVEEDTDGEVSAVAPSPFAPSPASGSIGGFVPVVGADSLAPVAFTPSRRSAVPLDEPDAPAAQPEIWAPRRATTEPLGEAELTGEVSAVVGAPSGGAPVSALGAVPLREGGDEIDDRTVLSRRHRSPWHLLCRDGVVVDLESDVVMLGRKPTPDPAFPGAQLVTLPGETVSKTHARLELRAEQWMLTDLGSTNGVLVRSEAGEDRDVSAPVALGANGEFLLGDELFQITRD